MPRCNPSSPPPKPNQCANASCGPSMKTKTAPERGKKTPMKMPRKENPRTSEFQFHGISQSTRRENHISSVQISSGTTETASRPRRGLGGAEEKARASEAVGGGSQGQEVCCGRFEGREGENCAVPGTTISAVWDVPVDEARFRQAEEKRLEL